MNIYLSISSYLLLFLGSVFLSKDIIRKTSAFLIITGEDTDSSDFVDNRKKIEGLNVMAARVSIYVMYGIVSLASFVLSVALYVYLIHMVSSYSESYQILLLTPAFSFAVFGVLDSLFKNNKYIEYGMYASGLIGLYVIVIPVYILKFRDYCLSALLPTSETRGFNRIWARSKNWFGSLIVKNNHLIGMILMFLGTGFGIASLY